MTARDCVQSQMEECGVFGITHPDVVETIRYMRLANYALNYICRDHVEGTQSFVYKPRFSTPTRT